MIFFPEIRMRYPETESVKTSDPMIVE
jgi:hypothetical protein